MLYHGKKSALKARRCSNDPNRSGTRGWYLRVLNWGFGIRIVVRDVRARVGLGDAEIRQEERDGLRRRGGAPVGMDGQLPRPNGFAGHRRDQALRQARRLPMGEEPANHVPTEDVECDVEIVAGPGAV